MLLRRILILVFFLAIFSIEVTVGFNLHLNQVFLQQYQQYAEYEGIIVALTSDKDYFHLLTGLKSGETTKIIPVMLENPATAIEKGDYVKVEGYYIYTLTIWNDPITHVDIPLASVLRNAQAGEATVEIVLRRYLRLAKLL